jgi:hypothetical protein
MVEALAKFQCPRCGEGPSHTALYPRAWAYDASFSDLKVPLVRICDAVVNTGVVLSFAHPLRAAVDVLSIGLWTWRQYFAPPAL